MVFRRLVFAGGNFKRAIVRKDRHFLLNRLNLAKSQGRRLFLFKVVNFVFEVGKCIVITDGDGLL